MLLTILIILAIILILIISTFFVFPWFVGAPYDITRKKSLENIIKLSNPKPEDKIAELGSGDGRVCIALALKNKNPKTIIHGYEINPFLVWISRNKIKKLGLQNNIQIYWKNFWKVNLSEYNKIIFFQFRSITKRLEKKFNKELKKGTKIISHNWKLPNWKIKNKLGKEHLTYGIVYLYEK
jgi:16S rRNA A1518/A1519 N6-dimethyltransferase RsmA/KsgA/DIM1 with predicted DNA glycosylase/AP lyase activity